MRRAWVTSPTALRRTIQIRGLEESFMRRERVPATERELPFQ
jgi:hypothetical protein